MFKDKPADIRKAQVKAMVARMAQAYGVPKKNLPNVLGCQKNVINNWGYYGRIPYDHLYHCHQSTGVSMDWLLHGDNSAIKLSDSHIAGLKALFLRLVADSADFNMIAEVYPGAFDQVASKLDKDLVQWAASLGVDKQEKALSR